MEAYLVLEDGAVYWGDSFGAVDSVHGEVVFNTSMTGYQEMLTDPSYAGQIVIPTYPLIGNYGINHVDQESAKIQVAGFAVRSECREPSHILSDETLDSYLKRHGVPGISGLDTRAVARRLRIHGVMRGMISADGKPDHALKKLHSEIKMQLPNPQKSLIEAWNEMIRMPEGEGKNKLIKDLKEYCGQDTWAMVEIHRILTQP